MVAKPKKKPATPDESGGSNRQQTQGKETSTTHLFHNWRTLINGNGQTGGAYCRLWLNATTSTKAKGDVATAGPTVE